MNFNSKNLLVTGGAGFIGSNFIFYLLNKYNNINIINLDKMTYAGSYDNMKLFKENPNFNFFKGDINDKKLVNDIFVNFKIDGVINFAAESHVDNSILKPGIFIESNIKGVFNLLNIAYENWMDSPFDTKTEFKHARFHQISTDEVYGSISNGSFSEESAYSPSSPYSSSKASADLIVRSFNKTYGLNTVTTISSNNFGNNQHREKLIPKTISNILNDKPICLYGDGKNIRDWIHVEDHCNAVDLVFNHGFSGEVYNVASNIEFKNLELINMILNITKRIYNKTSKIKFIRDRHGHDQRYSLDISKIKNELNWTPNKNFEEKLTTYIENFNSNLNNII